MTTTLKRYKPNIGDIGVFLTFLLVSLMGIGAGIITYNDNIYPSIMLFVSGTMLSVITSIPLWGQWVDKNGTMYLFPDKNEYTLER